MRNLNSDLPGGEVLRFGVNSDTFCGQIPFVNSWEVFVWRSCRARVCAGVGGVFSVGVSCVRVTC